MASLVTDYSVNTNVVLVNHNSNYIGFI